MTQATDSTEQTIWIANSAHCWGNGDTELSAVAKLGKHLPDGVKQDPIHVWAGEIEGFKNVYPLSDDQNVVADEIYKEREYLIDAETLRDVKKYDRAYERLPLSTPLKVFDGFEEVDD